MVALLVNLLIILVLIAILYLIFYLFSKYVVAIDPKIIGVICFIVFAILIVWALTGHNFVLLR